MSAIACPRFFTTMRPVSVTKPISAQGKSHLSKMRFTSSSRPLWTIMSIRSCEAVAPGRRSDVEDRIADALGLAARNLFVSQHAEAKCIHQRISFVGFVEINLSRDGRDAKAITIMRDAADNAGE